MVATADTSLMEASRFAQTSGRNSFFWTMVALAVLDIILLFWILNPLSSAKNDIIPSRLSASQVRTIFGDAASKRSPLGSVATTHVSPRVGRYRNGFTAVAYEGR
ncbi:MAG: hypothetical protein M3Y27_20485 [Acidobacteriota bacterium]|nr:hypothetical protein [Acidobacteriota bacterium]